MGSKYTKNQQQWNAQTKDLLKRIDNLKQNNINPNLLIPPRPTTITPKQLKKLTKISNELDEMERTFITPISEEILTKKRQGKAIDNIVSGKRGGRGNTQNLIGGNPNGNPQNLSNTGRPKGVKNTAPRSDTGVYRPYVVEGVLARYRQRIMEGALPPYTRDLLLEFFDNMEDDYGQHQFAQILHEGAQNGIHLTNDILYDSTGDKAIAYTVKIAEYMKDKGVYDKNKTLYMEFMEQYAVGDELYEFYDKFGDYED